MVKKIRITYEMDENTWKQSLKLASEKSMRHILKTSGILALNEYLNGRNLIVNAFRFHKNDKYLKMRISNRKLDELLDLIWRLPEEYKYLLFSYGPTRLKNEERRVKRRVKQK